MPRAPHLAPAGLLAALASALLAQTARGDEPPARPNLVVIYTDDQARWGVGAYGNPEVKTPNLDRLAREGALFRNAFTATPVCSPSRLEMMTSRYGTEFGVTDWIDDRVEPELGLPASAVTWPELLRGYGYRTGLFGKWHLGSRDRYHPTLQGYDTFFGFRGGGNRPMDPTLEVDGHERTLEGPLPDLLTDAALAFVEAHRDGPFLVSLHFRAPHAPYGPVPEADSRPLADLDPTLPPRDDLPTRRVKDLTRAYYASIHSVDRNVGRVLDRLDALGLSDRTIVLFTSDHGYQIGHNGLWHKGNAVWIADGHQGPRPNMFEESIRVPLLVRWPGVVPPGVAIDQVVSNLDLLPSILDMAGLGVPDNLAIRGRSFVPLLKGNCPDTWDDTLFGQYDMHHYAVARLRMVRTPEWKLIRHFEADVPDELYHLADDPDEDRNLAASAEARDAFDDLDARLSRWMRSVGDPLARPETR
jgi:uncharacterized sulfatase